MARKKKKSMVYLTDQSPSELKNVVEFIEDRISDMEIDEELMEGNGENILLLLRGVVSFIREEHLEEDDVEETTFEEEVDDHEGEDDLDGELEF